MEGVRFADILFIVLVSALIWGILILVDRGKSGSATKPDQTAAVPPRAENSGRGNEDS